MNDPLSFVIYSGFQWELFELLIINSSQNSKRYSSEKQFI